jgi:hypothetical protein
MFIKKKWSQVQRESLGIRNDNLYYRNINREFEESVEAFSKRVGYMDLEIKLLIDALRLARQDAGNLEEGLKNVVCTMPNDRYIELYSYTDHDIKVEHIQQENIAKAKLDADSRRLNISLRVLKNTQEQKDKRFSQKQIKEKQEFEDRADNDMCLATCQDLGLADIQFMSSHNIEICEHEDDDSQD